MRGALSYMPTHTHYDDGAAPPSSSAFAGLESALPGSGAATTVATLALLAAPPLGIGRSSTGAEAVPAGFMPAGIIGFITIVAVCCA